MGNSLFLDFDGTLVDIAPHPDEVEVAPALPGLIRKLSRRMNGRLAIISGRSLAALDKHLGPLDVAMAGSHGGEFRGTGSGQVEALAAPLSEVVEAELTRFAQKRPGLLVEPKPFSIAVHYRDRPEAEGELLAHAQALAQAEVMEVKHGKMVIELVMPGSDKGSAVAKFMAMSAFSGTRPLFVGDDRTDEDAFVKVLDYGGGGVLVGPDRETAAHWWLPGVMEVHAWLRAAVK